MELPGVRLISAIKIICRFCLYQTRSAWSMDQGWNKKHSPINNFSPTVNKFCVMWEGQAHDTKFRDCGGKIVDSRVFPSWSLIPGSNWSGLIKAEPGVCPCGVKCRVKHLPLLCATTFFGKCIVHNVAFKFAILGNTSRYHIYTLISFIDKFVCIINLRV